MKRTTCNTTGLVKYSSELAGKIAISNIQMSNKRHSKRGFREEPTEVFSCNDCNQFHLRRPRRALRV